MSNHLTRRNFLRGTSAAIACAAVGLSRRASAAPSLDVLETKTISYEPQLYHGWPTLARRKSGELLVSCSGGREGHVCPFGRVELMRSHDGGQSWTWPEVLLDGPIDDRDSGVLETARGTLLVTTFTSLADEPMLTKAEQLAPGTAGAWPAERLERWQAAHRRLDAAGRQQALGVWMTRSTDGGLTWSARYPTQVNSPHGPIQLADGKLLYAGVELWSSPRRVGVCRSTDDGKSWQWLAPIATRPGDNADEYHELHAVETADGQIVCQIRNHNKANSGETLQCESADGGKTWSEPRSIGVWGLPSHLVRLKDGRLLMTYGHRRAPLGNQARLSADHGRTWSEAIIISGDGASGDLGYPSTVELDDGTLVTVWYEQRADSPKAVLRQARWRLA